MEPLPVKFICCCYLSSSPDSVHSITHCFSHTHTHTHTHTHSHSAFASFICCPQVWVETILRFEFRLVNIWVERTAYISKANIHKYDNCRDSNFLCTSQIWIKLSLRLFIINAHFDWQLVSCQQQRWKENSGVFQTMFFKIPIWHNLKV